MTNGRRGAYSAEASRDKFDVAEFSAKYWESRIKRKVSPDEFNKTDLAYAQAIYDAGRAARPAEQAEVGNAAKAVGNSAEALGAGERGTIQWWIARCYEAENKLEALLAARPDGNVDKRGPAPSETAQKDIRG